MVSATIMYAPHVEETRDVPPAPATLKGFTWNFQDSMLDRNGDRLDDLIDVVAANGAEGLPHQADGFVPYEARDTPDGPRVNLYVAYETGVGASDIKLLEGLGLAPYAVDDVLPGLWITDATTEQARLLSALPGVVMVELNHKFRTFNTQARQAHRVDDTTTYARGVWEDLGVTGTGVGIAVLDTGVDDEHAYLTGSFVAGTDTANTCGLSQPPVNPDDDNVFVPIGTFIFHGTHVAGTALGSDPAVTNSGMATTADLYDVKVLTAVGASCVNSVPAGMNFATAFNAGSTLWTSTLGVPTSKKIHVVSMSLGGGCSDGSDTNSQRANFLADNGIIPVIATGNDALTGCITTPSAALKAISVGAVDDLGTVSRGTDVVASFSNCGPSITGSLPGRKPDVVTSGVNVVSAGGNTVPTRAAGTHVLSGTSMATPVVSGVVGLMKAANPALTAAEVKQILRETAEAKDGGRGSSDATYAKYHTCWGWGQLDAYGAVNRAQDLTTRDLSGPATASTSSSTSYTVDIDYSKSEFMTNGPSGTTVDGDVVRLELVFPASWTGISVSSTAANIASSYTSYVSAAVTTGVASGVASASFNFTGTPGGSSDIDDADANPTMTVSATTPSTAGTYVLTARFWINGIRASDDTISVVVS